MFASLRDRYEGFRDRFGTAGLVVAVIALIAALAGTAIAAKGGLTGLQKKEVTKIAKRYAGQDGAPGAQGPAGPAGANGKDGAPGPQGKAGEQGPIGLTGLQGPKGDKGDPWTAGDTLPKDATETGAWAMSIDATGVGRAAISFPIPLKAGASNAKVKVVNMGATAPTQCENEEVAGTASAEAPEADPGFLCVYAVDPDGEESPNGFNPFTTLKAGSANFGYSPSGAIVVVFATAGDAGKQAQGTWAVTGE